MFNRLALYQQKLPLYLACRTSPWLRVLLAPYLYFRCVPSLQDAPVFVLTMGKVGSITLWQSLLDAGVFFQFQTHHILRSPRRYPYAKRNIRSALKFANWAFVPWLLRRPRVRVVTVVREPIGRLISLYLFSYQKRFGGTLKNTSLEVLLRDFTRIFEHDYTHPLVPGYFLNNQITLQFDIDVYQHDFPQSRGTAIIEQGRYSLLLMRLEIADRDKAAALSTWMGRPISINRRNTAGDAGYSHLYEEFKRRVRIPYRYAEAIYRSSYMQHFYTAEERTKFWQRWEPQLDSSLELPQWIEKQLRTYHPRID